MLNLALISVPVNFYFYAGTEFKTTACPITGIMRYMEIQRGNEGMKSQKFNKEIGATAGFTLQLLLNAIPQEKEGGKHGIRSAVSILPMTLPLGAMTACSKSNSTMCHSQKISSKRL